MSKEGITKIDAALLIAIASGVGYGVVYIYELNFLSYYYLPDMYIDFNLKTIVRPLMLIVFLFSLVLLIDSFYNNKYKPMPQRILEYIGIKVNIYFILGITIFSLAILAGYIGDSNASSKKEYQVIRKEDGLYLAVYKYNESLIIAPVDVKKGIILPNYQLVKISSIKNSEIVRFEEGIDVKKIKNNTEFEK
ncbi:hypothetical protein LS684_21280 (plasmid) [Cytobacillus spongiae]|uniref:hypothetical protein n=1 Tax=Cytobacillus spongiae TaxID=2901381 RepID=UPI001F3421BF|nr:hypothetical protein [Cytobacillus spongiae]UII58155.1 hypothetical protein LS684_21280 [Cytobacillus spongiae]